MHSLKNEDGAVLVFVTLMIVLLLIMVGMGLDTGHLSYIRSQGQPAVDAAALAATSAIPSGDPALVKSRAAAFNFGGGNPGTGNNYLNSPNNLIGDNNVTLIKYDNATNTLTAATGVTSTSTGDANGVRVALESANPYGGSVGAPMKSPLFLAPLFNLLGQATSGTANVSVSAVARIQGLAGMPIAVADDKCGLTDTSLNFQGGGSAGWETYYIGNASASVIRDMWDSITNCEGQPAVDIGYCGNLNNGVITNIFNVNINNLFKADPTRCYLIPVVDHNAISNGNFNQCSNIIDWAKLCLNQTDPFNNAKDAPSKGQLRGSVTCGQSVFTSKDTQCFIPRLVRDTKSGM